ncbi:MAG: glycosyltransferase family 1 protein [Gemmatimonadetes bacterium]|nr:glycosyltransferase family 1 protein [Gemmatimonadota bacterium]
MGTRIVVHRLGSATVARELSGLGKDDQRLMRVLSVIITPPSYKASGGVSAGLKLAEHVAELVAMEAAIMSDRGGTSQRGRLGIRYFRCHNKLGRLSRFAPRQLVSLLWTSKIPEHIAATRPELVHFHNPFPPGALRSATQMCRRLGIPYVISSHGFVEMSGFATAFRVKAFVRPLVRLLIEKPFAQAVRAADRIFILSPLEQEGVAALGIPPERQIVVTNGVDAEFAVPVPAEVRTTLSHRLAWRSDVTNLLFVGNLTHNKGIDLLLHAMKRIRAPVRLVVGGALRSPGQASDLLRGAGLSERDDRIVFTDFLTFDELRALYQLADVFVFPSRADTLPLVILEAMVSGLPVVASNVGGIPYEVTPDCGIVFPSEDVEALASAIDELVCDAPRRQRMGAAARSRAASHFSWTRSAEKSCRAYSDVLDERATRAEAKSPDVVALR